MYNADLAFDKAPPLGAPLRFFLTAPLFGMAAALLVLWAGPHALATRWTPPLLSATHLLTLGVLAMVMIGAVIQMVAVVAGSPVARPRWVAGGVHALLTAGVVALGVGLDALDRRWLAFAMVLLGLGVAGFVGVVVGTVTRAPRAHDTVLGIGLAVLSLAFTAGLGLTLAAGYVFDSVILHRFPLTDAHLGWGIAGWMGLLVVGVAFQVVPMFQITPNYPDAVRRWLVKCIFAGLLMWSAGDLLAFWVAPPWVWLQRAGGAVLLAAYGTFAVVTLRLQARRRRRLADVTTDLWRVGMVSLLGAGLLWLALQWVPALAEYRGYPLLLGVLLLLGFALSVINGMLYKIVPFLVWFHLQNRLLAAPHAAALQLPNMKQIVTDRWARRQLRVHVAALLLALGAALVPVYLTHLSAAVLFVSFALLLRNLVAAALCFRRYQRQIVEAAAAAMQVRTAISS